MNYFELFGIAPQVFVDRPALKKNYYALSRQLHPDMQTTVNQTQQSLLDAAILNNAWETLGNTEKTLHYLLTITETITENEKYALSNDFLMEIMELKEQLMEAEMDENIEQKEKLNEKMIALAEDLKEKLKQLDLELKQKGLIPEVLNKLKDLYYKQKYVLKNSH